MFAMRVFVRQREADFFFFALIWRAGELTATPGRDRQARVRLKRNQNET